MAAINRLNLPQRQHCHHAQRHSCHEDDDGEGCLISGGHLRMMRSKVASPKMDANANPK